MCGTAAEKAQRVAAARRRSPVSAVSLKKNLREELKKNLPKFFRRSPVEKEL